MNEPEDASVSIIKADDDWSAVYKDDLIPLLAWTIKTYYDGRQYIYPVPTIPLPDDYDDTVRAPWGTVINRGLSMTWRSLAEYKTYKGD